MISYLFFALVAMVWTVHSTEYYIKEGAIPSYLHWKQQPNSSKDIFPRDILVNVSFSRVIGTFAYCFGRNQNQLIVTMRDGLPHVMDIELNTQIISVSLPSICGCDRCRYEALELRIQLGSNIQVQCNGRDIKMIKNQYENKLNENYPINTKKKRSIYSNDLDHMWLVNTPQYENTFPNNDQLSGCIFKVEYNEHRVTFTEVTPNIDYKCVKTCTDNICNGGQCYETFNGAPICNCTSTFRNGPYCNETIGSLNIQTNDSNMQTDSFKLSWNSTIDQIFELKNKHTRLQLEVRMSALVLEYKTERTRTEVVLSNTYDPVKEYICILRFHRRHIEIRLSADGSWTNEMMPTNQDLRKEIFESLLLQSGDGIIEIVYQDNEEYQWRKLPIKSYITIPTTDSTTIIDTTTTTTTQPNKTIWILSVMMVLIIVGSIVSVIFVCRKLKYGLKQIFNKTDSKHVMINEYDFKSSLSSDHGIPGDEKILVQTDVPPSKDNNNQTQDLI